MPKEFIFGADFGREFVAEDTKQGYTNNDAISVGWSKDVGDVQVRVVDKATDPDGFDVKTITLDRNGINRLIRTLRHARDDAFGRDE